jgi:TaqI restriction endonuclease
MDVVDFEEFLSTIDLDAYRLQFRGIKILEMDLPQKIWPIHAIYDVYWTSRQPMSFENFYPLYTKKHRGELREFREKIGMCSRCFNLGLKARVYRTWTALLTQIHLGYLAEGRYGAGSVHMNSELDAAGVDLAVLSSSFSVAIQIKKSSNRKDARLGRVGLDTASVVQLDYEVPSHLADPYKRNGELRVGVKRFMEREDLKALENGFVVFTVKCLNFGTVA